MPYVSQEARSKYEDASIEKNGDIPAFLLFLKEKK